MAQNDQQKLVPTRGSKRAGNTKLNDYAAACKDIKPPLLKKRRLSQEAIAYSQDPLLSTVDDAGRGLRMTFASTRATGKAPLKTFSSPRPPRKLKKICGTVLDSTSHGATSRVNSSLPFFPGSAAGHPLRPSQSVQCVRKSDTGLDSCRVSYCSGCLNRMSKQTVRKILESVQTLDGVIFRLRLEQCTAHPSQNIADFYTYDECASPLTRCQIVGFMLHCQRKLPSPLSPNTFHLGLQIFDRFVLRNIHDCEVRSSLPIAGAALIIASKMEDVWSLHVDDLILSGGYQFNSADILHWEVNIIQSLDFELSWPTAFSILTEFLRVAIAYSTHEKAVALHSKTTCHCHVCNSCGRVIPYDNDPIMSLAELGVDTWEPKYREARGRPPLYACSLYVLDIILCHPESIRLTSELLASLALVLTVEVLNKEHTFSTYSLLPPIVRAIVDDPTFVQHISDGFGMIEEHVMALQFSRGSETDFRDLAEVHDVHLREAMKENDPKEKQIKYTVYLMLKANREGKQISAVEARQCASRWLESEDISLQAKNDWRDVASVVPQCILITNQPPTKSEPLRPLGRFASDIYAKHRDAASLFVPLFHECAARVRDLGSRNKIAHIYHVGGLGVQKLGRGRQRVRANSVLPLTCHNVRRSQGQRRRSCPPVDFSAHVINDSTRTPKHASNIKPVSE